MAAKLRRVDGKVVPAQGGGFLVADARHLGDAYGGARRGGGPCAAAQHRASRRRRIALVASASGLARGATKAVVELVNPLAIDGFAEPGGYVASSQADADASKPLLVFFPGMDGSLSTPFMQYPELATTYELACLRHIDGLASRATFVELVDASAAELASATSDGRQALLVGESFGATLAIAVAHRLRQSAVADSLRGLVLVNPATSYARSALAVYGPLCASLSGPWLWPLYALSLVAFSTLVLTPLYQTPSMLSMLASRKIPSLLNNPHREAFLGRVALGAFLNVDGPGYAIGELLRMQVFAPQDLAFRLRAWLEEGARQVNQGGWLELLEQPVLAIVGDTDRLLPSADEARRLEGAVGAERWRGTVVVPGAGHASTLGNRVNLAAEFMLAFGEDFSPPLEDVDLVQRAAYPASETGWDRGMVDRTYPPLNVEEYTRWNRGGDLYDEVGTAGRDRA